MTKLLSTTAMLLALTHSASAATIEAKECTHQKDCYAITVSGELQGGDGNKFVDLVREKQIKKAVVSLDSIGGDFWAGLRIAYEVRDREFTTWVSDGHDCQSMCAIIWMGGSTRYYEDKARIGFHGVYTVYTDKAGKVVNGTKPVPSSSSNALVGGFFAKLGLSDKAIYTLTVAAPDDMYWLNAKSTSELGIKADHWKS
jgi:hypothetical protein